MSNKIQLQANNIDLQTIKNAIEDLPLADDVKNGQYVWGKYTTEGTPVIITADNQSWNSEMRIVIKVYSSNIDVGYLNAADFVGTTMTREGESYPTVTFTSATECVHTYNDSTDPETVTWDYDGGIITVNSYLTGTWDLNRFSLDISGFNKTIGDNVFVGYVVSNSADEYPDAGTQGEYYYDRIKNNVSDLKLTGWYTYDSDENTMKPPIYAVRSSGVIYDNEIHILGGNSIPNAHYKWSKKTKTWIESMSIPYSFNGGEAVVLNGEIHTMGSVLGQARFHYKWNGSTWEKVSTLPYDFSYGSAVVLNGVIHILGGEKGDTSHYVWDTSSWVSRWKSVSTLPYTFTLGCAVVLNNEIHILGTSSNASDYAKSHYKWNGSTWEKVSTLPYDFMNGGAVVLNGEIHILGINETDHYKFDGSVWTKVSELRIPFNDNIAIVYDDEIHVIGADDNGSPAHYAYAGQ